MLRLLAVVALAAVLGACETAPTAEGDDAPDAAAEPATQLTHVPATAAETDDAETNAEPESGTIVGRVVLRASEPLPGPVRIDVSADAWLARVLPDGIDDPARAVQTDRTLPHVFVYMAGARRSGAVWPDAEGEVVVRIPDARFDPRVLGVREGQPLRVWNDAQIVHCIRAKPKRNDPAKQQIAPGESVAFVFRKKEKAIPLWDDVYSWMSGHVFVVDHPFFATTGADGGFEIANVPAGPWELRAWHELHGEVRTQVDVPAGGVAEVVLELPPVR